eukprot:CAMPEP_0181534226 /NCGR_PEP_ID=MMETSP1110-20121109/73600_1 /TAXON_ID=174948 /ORGANISM="Symbiodinium sp., Strain CCMP421" /LENGTH=180 /DNA_ID=CAMNT_0023665507 /DNA_START=37 /DNA_END=575 /DNA_ORIENTATION=+
MSDTKWGFDTNYGHRTLPFKWQSSNGFHFYEDSPLTKKNFRPSHLPALRADHLPMTTHYGERTQTSRWAMSSYGCHRNLVWDASLRMPRNPFPGRASREMSYIKEACPEGLHTMPRRYVVKQHAQALEPEQELSAALDKLEEDVKEDVLVPAACAEAGIAERKHFCVTTFTRRTEDSGHA